MLRDVAYKYYKEQNYNCAETIIRAANEYYELGLHDRDMIMMGGYGGGMQTGNTCGTILSCVAVLSMKYIESRAHDSKDIRPVTVQLTKRMKEVLGSTLCCEIKPKFFVKEIRCENTILHSCDVLEEVLNEYKPKES